MDETVEKLKGILQVKGVTLFAVVDHSGEAEKVGMKMRPTKLLIFGNPKAGTPVMLAVPSSAIDLPLKILVWRGFSKIYSVTGSLPCSDGTTSTVNSTGYSRPACFSIVLSVSVPNFHRAARRDLRSFLILRSALASRSNRSKKLSFGRPCLTECRWID